MNDDLTGLERKALEVALACVGGTAAVDAPTSGPESSPVAWATHPDVDGGITFSVFLRAGFVEMLEGASTTAWPESDDGIVFMLPQPDL